MATERDDSQLAQGHRDEAELSWSEEENTVQDNQYPPEKSGVGNDPKALGSATMFQKHDDVHMSQIENGMRTKGVFKVYKSRKHPSGYSEYQLMNEKGTLYKKGAWVRERDLRRGK